MKFEKINKGIQQRGGETIWNIPELTMVLNMEHRIQIWGGVGEVEDTLHLFK